MTAEEKVIARWIRLNILDENILIDYKPECKICGYKNDRNNFQKYIANDIFHAGKLERYLCPVCGVIFGPRKMLYLDDKEFGQDYRDLYSYYKEGDTINIEKKLIEWLNPKKEGVYLIYGCRGEQTITPLRVQGYNIYGFDPFANDHPYIIRDYKTLLKYKFDGIISNNLIEHLKDPVNEFKLIHNVLKSNGKMIHATECYEYKIEFTHYHLFFFTGQSVNFLCKKTGFSIDKIERNVPIAGQITSYAIFSKL